MLFSPLNNNSVVFLCQNSRLMNGLLQDYATEKKKKSSREKKCLGR